jgi:hypothetical protein
MTYAPCRTYKELRPSASLAAMPQFSLTSTKVQT